MSFRVKITNPQKPTPTVPPDKKPVKIYTQEDIDLIDEKYKEKELLYQRSISELPNPLEQYKKSLMDNTPFEKETIVFDQTISKWVIVKDPSK